MKDFVIDLVKATGWRIIPCSPFTKRPLLHDAGEGFENASSDLDRINDWWSMHRSAMYGLPTGKMNNLVVLDVDFKEGKFNGFETLKELESQGMMLPETLRVATPGKGMHCYFNNPSSYAVRNSVRKLGAGLDIRGNGGYVIGFGSINAEGGVYRPENEADIADMPDWLIELCRQAETEHRKCSSRIENEDIKNDSGSRVCKVSYPKQYLAAAFFNSCNAVKQASSGSRNETLFHNAISLYSLAAGGMFSFDEVEEALRNACTKNGYIAEHGEGSFMNTMKQAMKRGFSHPRSIKRRVEND